MANWPPSPNKPPEGNQSNPQESTQGIPKQYAGKEWQLLEKTLMASIEEQRKTRKWSLIFKGLTFAYLFLLLILMARGCTGVPAGPNTAIDHIAVVDVAGVIGADSDANSERISSALTKAFEASGSKAVVLNINSPGGSPVQSDEIWRTMRALKAEHKDKKLYAAIGDVGASGAYYIASAADEIWVNPSSLVGSIGVIMPNYGVENLAKKLGVDDRTLTSGEHKDILSFTKPIDPFEEQHVQGVLDNVHGHFINAVKQGRGDKLKDTDANQTFSGLFWSGEQAIGIGLADKTGGVKDIGEALEVEDFVNYTPQDPFEQLFGNLGVTLSKSVGEGIGTVLGDKLVNQAEQQTPMLK